MKNIYFILLLLNILLFSSCSNSKPKTTITTALDSEEIEYVVVTNNHTGLEDSLLSTGTANIEIAHPQFIDIVAGEKSGKIYVTPGSQISISSSDDELDFAGDYSNENNMMVDLNQAMSSRNAIMPLFEIAGVSEADFLESIKVKKGKFDSIVGTIENIDPAFKTIIDKRINASISSEKMMYPNYYQYLTKDTIQLSENYDDYLADIDINDPDLLHFYEGQRMIQSVIERDVDYGESAGQYFNILFNKVDEEITHQATKEYLWKEYLTANINFGGGLDSSDEMLATFATKNTNSAYQKDLDAIVEVWDALRKGKNAPGFDGVTTDGKMVALEDLKGKNVYVDVWATWCGPCIAEIPSLKEVEHEFHDENIEFVSISIDQQKDKEKWINFVADKELGGTQIMADNAWQSDVATNYNIKGIPRFILIDTEGKIVSANAPRPSNPKLKDMLTAL